MSEIVYVKQKEPDGCMVACVAMVTGKSYEEIREMCSPAYNGGINEIIADSILQDFGFATIRKYKHIPRIKQDREGWPIIAPFAPTHICLVNATQGAHAVVMDQNGEILDPFKPERHSLLHPDYSQVHWVAGYFQVHPIRGRTMFAVSIDDAQDFLSETVTVHRTTASVKIRPEVKP